MLDALYSPLKRAWERLVADTRNWLAPIESKYSKGTSNDIKAAREALHDMTSRLETMDAQMQRAAPDTNAGLRDIATRMQVFLEDTDMQFEQLTTRSQGDATTEKYAHDVKKAREAVAKQVQVIHEATSVLVTSSTPPGAGLLPGTSSASTGSASSDGTHTPAPTPPVVPASTLPNVPTGSLFLDVMICLASQSPTIVTPENVIFTNNLLFGKDSFPLSDKQLDGLTQSWNKVIGVFFNPATLPKTGSSCTTASSEVNVDLPGQEANLLEVHGELEELYDKVEEKVIRITTEILASNI